MKDNCIAILMATFNGEKYISQQIESIRNQSYAEWHLLIRDDCSIDNTDKIINSYVLLDKRIKKIKNKGENLGACLNFGELMKVAFDFGYEYVMFSDQDDVWEKDKIEKTFQMITKYEQEKKAPILVHTDFCYADENLNPIKYDNRITFARLSKKINKINILANYNYIFGCTMLFNRALLSLCLPVHKNAQNHDYWIALHAAAFGDISYLNNKTMLYRQHGNNVSGGVQYSSWRNRFLRLINFDIYKKNKYSCLIQFKAFFKERLNCFNEEQKELYKNYLKYSEKGGWRAVLFMILNGFKSKGFLQTFIYYLTVFLDKR